MCCDELWGRPCDDIGADECPEDVTIEEVKEIAEKSKTIKVEHGIATEKKTEKKPRTVKISDEKTEIFEYLTDFLPKNYDISVLKPNKLIEISYNGKKFKLDLIETREKKTK